MAIFNSYVCLPDGIISNYCIEQTSIFPIGSPFTMDLPTTTQNLRFDGGHPRTPWSVHPKHCTWFITNISIYIYATEETIYIYMQLRRLYIYTHIMYVTVLPIEPITRMHTSWSKRPHRSCHQRMLVRNHRCTHIIPLAALVPHLVAHLAWLNGSTFSFGKKMRRFKGKKQTSKRDQIWLNGFAWK